MNRGKLTFILISICFVVFILSFTTLFTPARSENQVLNPDIWWSKQWKEGNDAEYRTAFQGSEFRFAFERSSSIAFRFITESRDLETQLRIHVDGNEYIIENPNINSKRLEILFSDADIPRRHTVTAVYFCPGISSPCEMRMKEIVLTGGQILPFEEPDNETIAVLGDSVSLYNGKNNYTVLAAERLQMQLHNASVWGRTLTRSSGIAPAIDAYQNQIVPFSPDIIILFLGANDVLLDADPEEFERDYENLLGQLRVKLPNATILSVGILPGQDKNVSDAKITLFNTLIMNTASKNDVMFLSANNWLLEDDYQDQIHPNAAGQLKIAEQLVQVIKSEK